MTSTGKILRAALAAAALMMIAASCSTVRNITYFQDLKSEGADTLVLQAPPVKEIRLQPEDKISIIVNSKDPALAMLFNLPYVTRQIGQNSSANVTSDGTAPTSQGIAGYTIRKDGTIDFPILGSIKVAGMNRAEVADHIKDLLISNNWIKDPVVTVEYMNLSISVLGEVTRPGRYSIDRDRLTILDALSMAGDMTIYGQRGNVMVLRDVDGVQQSYAVNLLSADQLYSSPVYYLKQNDVVYVEPNPMRARQSTVNGNNVRSASFWMSLASLLTTISVLIVK